MLPFATRAAMRFFLRLVQNRAVKGIPKIISRQTAISSEVIRNAAIKRIVQKTGIPKTTLAQFARQELASPAVKANRAWAKRAVELHGRDNRLFGGFKGGIPKITNYRKKSSFENLQDMLKEKNNVRFRQLLVDEANKLSG
jgi:hypothetical protein